MERKRIFHDKDVIGKRDCPDCGACHYLCPMLRANQHGNGKEQYAISYFHLLQLMLNGYFSSPAFQSATWQEKAELHEKILPKLFDCMLYGIAKGEK